MPRRRGISSLAAAGALLCALLAPAAAQASPGDLTYTPSTSVVGEQITFTYDVGCSNDPTNPTPYTYTVDGVARPPQASKQLVISFATAQAHTVAASNTDIGTCSTLATSDSVTLTPEPAMTGTISVSPDPPAPGQTATLAATQEGGYPGFDYVWDSDNDGAFDDETTRTITKAFPNTTPRTFRVRITDRAVNTHEVIVSRTITAVAPQPSGPSGPTGPPQPGAPAPAQTSDTPAPPAAPCRKQLAFGVSEFTTTGCFDRVRTSPSEQWTTTASVKLNGLVFLDFGQTFTITFPTPGELGGHFKAPSSSIQFGGFTAFSGNIDWTLPAGEKGDAAGEKGDKLLRTVTVLAGTKIFGLNVRGQVGLRLGFRNNGTHYASLPLTIELPASFKAGPDSSLGSATGSAALRVDEGGAQFDGLKLEAKDVWIGKLQVPEVCFSFVPSGSGGVTSCAAPLLNGKPYITCNSDVNTDRWDGSAVVALPSTGVQLAAFGGLADGRVSKLGGFVTDLGRKAPITPNVYLNTIGVGLCLTPPPFKLKGTVGVAILPLPAPAGNTAEVDGSFLYSDPSGFLDSWSLTVDGAVKVFDRKLGSGNFTYRPSGGLDFGLTTGFTIEGLASLNGKIDGWIDANRGDFAVTGSVEGCVVDVLCAKGSGTVSSVGVAGCLQVYETYTDYGTIVISLNGGGVSFRKSVIDIKAGFGYNWVTKSGSLFGSSCNFAPYQPTRAVARAAASTPTAITQQVAPGTPAVSLRIHGTDGPPKVTLRGPGGRTITSPTTVAGKQLRGEYLLAENKTDGTTNVLLLKPAAGTWTVSAVPGARSRPTSIDRAKIEAPPALAAKVRRAGGTRVVDVAYAVPRGASVRLMEVSKGVSTTVARTLRGQRCASSPRTRPGSDQLLLCAKVPFRPSRGPGGVRTIQALVTRGGMPLVQKDIAKFTAPREALPARPAPLRARRSRGSIVVQFAPVPGVSRYTVAAQLSDGRKLGFDLESKCRAVRIADVPAGVAATVKVAGVRYDLAIGATRSITLKANAATAGKSTRPRDQWRPLEPCT